MADHQVIINSQIYKLIPLGFCKCGCGEKTTVAKRNSTARGWIKGRPIKYIRGHHVTLLNKKRFNNNNDNLVEMYNRGMSTKELSIIYNTDRRSIWRKLKNCGCKIRPRYLNINTNHYVKDKINKDMQEHKAIVERVLDRTLPIKAVVHHVNGLRYDNDNTNLIVCENQAYHMYLHQRQRALKSCGHASWLKCRYCGTYDDPANLILEKNGYGRHRKCINELFRRIKLKKDQKA